MIDPMRHMGISGKFALITAVAALGMLVLTAITLEEAVMVTFLGLVAVAYVAAVAEVLLQRRHIALVATGVGSSLTIAFSLAFLSTWELAFVDQSTIIGTPLPTDDPDNYFFWAAASAVATVLVLFLGAAWPSGSRLGDGNRLVAGGGRKRSPSQDRPAARRTSAGRTPATRSPATRNTGATAQRSSGSRAPARLPAAAARRPSSSASPARKPAPKPVPPPAPTSGAKTTSRR
jgi:hypothetical protein